MTSIAELTPLTEREFQRQVTELAEMYGWTWMHIRAGRTMDSWRTPVSGPLGAGFPDLVLLHQRDHRLLFVEIKTDAGRVSAAQTATLEALTAVEHYRYACKDGCSCGTPPDVRVELWRPSDWALIEATLKPVGAKERAA